MDSYHYVDMAFCAVIQYFLDRGILDFVMTYDIACKYGINFLSRVTGGPIPILSMPKPDETSFTKCVNKMHITGHKIECTDNFSLNYTPGVGRTSGESVETIWPAMNSLQYSTREMTAGAREEVLTDHFNHWNWRKRVVQSKSILVI